jgi:hypothetical protein
MVDRETSSILKRLIDQWTEIRVGLSRINGIAEVRPDESHVFRAVDGQSAEAAFFELRPVVFNFPEDARHRRNDLYVVVRGLISFRRGEFRETSRLLTHSFATEVAYFRRRGDSLEHVFGAHYDFSPDSHGHPTFHGQLKSYATFGAFVGREYRVNDAVSGDAVNGILERVRVPTAQMDVFSLVVQMCADHLLFAGSAPEETAAFSALLAKNAFCHGAAFQVPRLGTDEARQCYRARHWYPS